MAWIPFAFPRCPNCEQAWTTSYHRNCHEGGQLELDPDARAVRCDGCGGEWSIWDSRFFCVCEHEFSAQDVRGALRDLIEAASRLARIFEENRHELARIRQSGDASLRAWLNRFAQGLAGSLGTAVGHLINTLFGGR